MATVKQSKETKKNKTWILLLILLLVGGGGAGYIYWTQKSATRVQAAAPAFNTTSVRRGNISLEASGSGTLVAAAQNQLSFSSAGTVGKVDVQAGDVVQQDQVLAQLNDLEPLQAALASAQQDLLSAQQALDTLKQNGPANIASAQLALSTAQKAVSTAQSGLIRPGAARCDADTTSAYYNTYLIEQQKLKALGDGGGNNNYYLTILLPQKNVVARALAAYQNCAGFTSYEISASQANLALTTAQEKQAQATLDLLQKNNGVNPIDLAVAENKVTTAQAALDLAQANLDGATLKAPYSGTILSVAGQPGDSVGSAAFITIADLAHPQVQFAVDETDLDKVALGEPAQVVFDALPDSTFTGKVIRINPALVTQNNTNVVEGVIQLDLGKQATLPVLPQGLSATVTLVKASAKNVLLVPLQAVRSLGDGTYSVFVVGPDHSLVMKLVKVGLQDSAFAEIQQGLAAGDVVSTGSTQTK